MWEGQWLLLHMAGQLNLFLPEQTGWLAEPLNISGLAAALDVALSLQSSERAALAKMARKHMEQYFQSSKCDKTTQIYQKLLDIA